MYINFKKNVLMCIYLFVKHKISFFKQLYGLVETELLHLDEIYLKNQSILLSTATLIPY